MTIETLLDEIETEANRVIMVDEYDLPSKRIASRELTIFILNKVAALRAALQSVRVEAWECFCDEAYFHQWAVRPKGENRWGHCFHVPTENEARGLCGILNGITPKPPGESA